MYRLETAVWEITLRCNMACLHCGSQADAIARNSELTTAEALDLIEQLAELGCRKVTFSGGEPFLREDWAILAQRVKLLGMEIAFISNGLAITDEVLMILHSMDIKSVSLSLDGLENTHDMIRNRKGAFKHVEWLISQPRSKNVVRGVVSSIHKDNFGELDRMLDFLIKHKIPTWQIQMAAPFGRMPKELCLNYQEFKQLIDWIATKRKKYQNVMTIKAADCMGYHHKSTSYQGSWQGCMAGVKAIGIESNGNIKGCLSLQGDCFIEGNIRKTPLKDIWTNKEAFKLNRRFEKSMLEGPCQKCAFGAVCRGGCTSVAFAFTKNFYNNPYCMYALENDLVAK